MNNWQHYLYKALSIVRMCGGGTGQTGPTGDAVLNYYNMVSFEATNIRNGISITQSVPNFINLVLEYI